MFRENDLSVADSVGDSSPGRGAKAAARSTKHSACARYSCSLFPVPRSLFPALLPLKRFKETPADCQIASQALMMRGGYIKPVGNGIFTLFPITKRITSKIEAIIRQEMNRIDGQEVLFPVAMPADIWRKSGRFDAIGSELLRFKDRSGADMVLGMTHEEASVQFMTDPS